jgi:hypothetical protein
VAGVCRQTINEWRNHDPDFIRALNIARNELVRATMEKFRERAARLTDAALAGVAAAIKRGDAATARWWLERAGIDEVAQRLFQQTVDPVILPEDVNAIYDEMAAVRVDAYLTAKGIGALERLRLREAMTAKEAEALREEPGEDDAEE